MLSHLEVAMLSVAIFLYVVVGLVIIGKKNLNLRIKVREFLIYLSVVILIIAMVLFFPLGFLLTVMLCEYLTWESNPNETYR
jgi:MFS-type transporter involved in bile tolerance (Atg22 family)